MVHSSRIVPRKRLPILSRPFYCDLERGQAEGPAPYETLEAEVCAFCSIDRSGLLASMSATGSEADMVHLRIMREADFRHDPTRGSTTQVSATPSPSGSLPLSGGRRRQSRCMMHGSCPFPRTRAARRPSLSSLKLVRAPRFGITNRYKGRKLYGLGSNRRCQKDRTG